MAGVGRQRLLETLEARGAALRAHVGAIALASAAAGAAWLIAREATGVSRPFFAPVAAVLALGLSAGAQLRRAVQVGVGVALGIGVADLIVAAIGSGGWQLVLVVFLAMCAAVLAGGSMLLVNQAAITAIFVVVLAPPSGGVEVTRFEDALIGGAVAVAVAALTPRDPLRLMARELELLLSETAAVLRCVARAIEQRDPDSAHEALQRSREIDPDPFLAAVADARETLAVTARRRDARERIGRFSERSADIDHAVRNTRVLARGALRPLETGEEVPDEVPRSLRELAEVARTLGPCVAGRGRAQEPVARAIAAARLATSALEHTHSLFVSTLVGQARLIATDLLLAVGLEREEAIAAVRAEDPPAAGAGGGTAGAGGSTAAGA